MRRMTYGVLVDVRWSLERYREEEGTPRLLILAAMVWNTTEGVPLRDLCLSAFVSSTKLLGEATFYALPHGL